MRECMHLHYSLSFKKKTKTNYHIKKTEKTLSFNIRILDALDTKMAPLLFHNISSSYHLLLVKFRFMLQTI